MHNFKRKQTESSKYWTEREVAERFQIGRNTMIRIRERGEIEYMRIGKRLVRYTEEQISKYEKRRTRQENPVRELYI